MPNDDGPDFGRLAKRVIESAAKGAVGGAAGGAVLGLANPIAILLAAAGGAAGGATLTLVEESPRVVRALWTRIVNRHKK